MVGNSEQLLLLISTPIYVILIGLEFFLSYWHDRKYYTIGDTVSNVYLMLCNMGLDFLLRGVAFFTLTFAFQFRFITIEQGIWYWLALFVAEDFIFYWLHRVDHYSRLFWAVHVTHHSSSHFNLTTGFRSSVFQPLYRFIWFIPLALLGFRAVDIFLMYSVTQIYGIIIHTQMVVKLGWLEYFLVTPSHHRVHHASNVPYLDKNMGMVLILWDQLFGTFQKEEELGEPIRYGLYGKDIHRDPANIIFHEWKSLWHDIRQPLPWRIRLAYLFKPPGWSHDQSTKTSKQLREEREASLKKN